MKLLFLFPLNEPFDTVVNAGKTPWKSKLNAEKTIKKIDCVYPSGLLSIGSYLKKHLPDAEIRILDCNVVMNRLAASYGKRISEIDRELFFEECAAAVKGFVPDLIGISALFCSNYQDLEAFARFWKRKVPGALLIGGGHLTAAIYGLLFEKGTAIDAISFGEGELPLLRLCEAMRRGESREYLAASNAWITAEKLKADPQFRLERELLEDLDEIPPFDFSMMVFPDVYFNSSRYFFVIETAEDCREMFLFSTRGCPHHCVFCASQNVHGHKVRYYSTERIKSDILHYHRTFGVNRFVFYDDHFLVRKKRAIEILDFVAGLGLRAEIPTPAFFAIDDEVAAAMHRAGIREVNITIESGNPETLRNIMHKPANLDRAEAAVAALHRQDILAISNILIGLPGETPESIEAGVRYLMGTDINWFQCFVTAPLPGSELYDICRENGYLATDDPFAMDFKKCVIRTPDFEPEFIEHKAYEMNLRLNFLNNYDYRTGNYRAALHLFERILNTVISTHAFACYFAAKCCDKLGDSAQYAQYRDRYLELIETYPFWKEWAEELQLEPLG